VGAVDERERWMMAVQARLERVTAQDLSPVLEEAALDEAHELTRVLTDDPDNLAVIYLLGWLHWYRYQALPKDHHEQDLQALLSMFTPCFINGANGLPEPLLPMLVARAIPAAIELLQQTQRSDNLELLTVTVDLWQRILNATPADYLRRASILSNLGIALVTRFERTEAAEDLDAAVEAGQQAVHAAPVGHPDRARYLHILGHALRIRFERSGAAGDLDGAVEAWQQAVQAAPADHPDRAAILSNLGAALVTRFERTRAVADVDAAIEARHLAVDATPADHPRRAAMLTNLGSALQARFERTRAIADVDAAVQAGQQAVQAAPVGHSDRARYLAILGHALRIRFERSGAAGDLDGAVEAGQQAVEAASVGHPDRAAILSNLGAALVTRFERSGVPGDLDAGIEAVQQAVQAAPADHPDHAMYLSNLGNALRIRFERSGAAGDLDGAVEAGQQAVQAAPVGHPDRAAILSNLGNALRIRFERSGAAGDLDGAVEAGQQAVQAAPAGHPDRARYLSNLGIALRARFERTGAVADVDAAIEAGQQAVQATPAGQPERAGRLSNLGAALVTRFKRTGTAADLDAAIETGQQAVQAAPADRPNRAMYLSNLEAALVTRFERTGTAADLDAAIEAGQQVLHATPADHPNRAIYLSNLGTALSARFKRTGAVSDLDAAVCVYSEAASAELATASARISAGRAAARLVAETDPERAASLLDAAVLLLPVVATRSLERGDQQFAIGRFAGLAAEAAAAALSDPSAPEPQRPARALRLLESARGILLSQALSSRGDLSELSERYPELAARFTELRDWLDQPSLTPGTDLPDNPGKWGTGASQQAIAERRQTATEFTRLIAHIRGLDGFANFALPPTVEHLLAQGVQGPVVVFNVAARRSDAIMVTSGSITSHPLPGLDQATVTSQVGVFYQALGTITGAGSLMDQARAQETLQQVLSWLWDYAAGPVLRALGYEGSPSPGEPWPRLWWVPGGLMSLLPVHAAGHHASPSDLCHRTVMDRVISSYTPTVGALAHARTPRMTATPGIAYRSLIVAMPTTPGLPRDGRLPYVPAEADRVQARLPDPTLLIEPPDGTAAMAGRLPTRAAVLKHLPSFSIAHFACHGYTDPADPSKSRLLLHDHRQNPLTVAALAPLALDHARLAYLSACSTARTGDTRLLDEAINLATAFQLAGFPHVIGTLWEINDQIAVEIADNFYAALTNPDGTVEPDGAARALHHAARTQRDQHRGAPYLWASHIHAGA
jgi:hypothetical protein